MPITETLEKEEQFCEDLTELLLRYGFGIADEPHVYDLLDNHIDYNRKASIDEESRLQFV